VPELAPPAASAAKGDAGPPAQPAGGNWWDGLVDADSLTQARVLPALAHLRPARCGERQVVENTAAGSRAAAQGTASRLQAVLKGPPVAR